MAAMFWNCGSSKTLKWKSCNSPHMYNTHFQERWHTHAHLKPDRNAHAYITQMLAKKTRHRQVTYSTGDALLGSHTLARGLQTHRSDRSYKHTPFSASLSHRSLPVLSSQCQRKKKKTHCWLWFSGVTSPTQNVLVTPESTLCQPVPFWDHTHTQAAISGCWNSAFFLSRVKSCRDPELYKHSRTMHRELEPCRL